MEIRELEIKSNIADYNGKWDKVDVEDEIYDCLGIKPEGNDWIQFIIDHFDAPNPELGKLFDTVAKTDAIEDIKLRFPDGGWIRITKKRK